MITLIINRAMLPAFMASPVAPLLAEFEPVSGPDYLQRQFALLSFAGDRQALQTQLEPLAPVWGFSPVPTAYGIGFARQCTPLAPGSGRQWAQREAHRLADGGLIPSCDPSGFVGVCPALPMPYWRAGNGVLLYTASGVVATSWHTIRKLRRP